MQNPINNDRRRFFKTVGTAAAAVAATAPLLKPEEASAALPDRFTAAYRHTLSLDGQPVGILRSFDGGEAYGEVVLEPVDTNGVVKKHIAGVKYEDITAAVGADMNPALYAWIQSMLLRQPATRNGAISSADANGRVRIQTTFLEGFLSQVGFPALDVAAKEPATINLRIACGFVQEALNPSAEASLPPAKPKLWLPSNFRLLILGIAESATARIQRVDAFTVKQRIVDAGRGFFDVEPLEIGPLAVTLPEQDAQPFYDWHHQFVIQGVNSDSDERTALLQYLSPSGSVLFTLVLGKVGIYRVSRLSEDGRRAGTRRVKAEMYCETAELFVGEPPTA